MADYASDEEQLEAIKEWWQENGRSIVAGVILGVLVLAGWRGWQWYRDSQAEAASAVYVQLTQQRRSGDSKGVTAAATKLRDEYGGTAYAPLAALAAARTAVNGKDLKAAAGWLRWAMNNANDTHVAALARVRLARVQLAQDQAAAALDLLDAEHDSIYDGLFQEVRGDILFDQNKPQAAATAYQAALDATPAPGDTRTLKRKLGQARAQAAAGANGADDSADAGSS